MRLAIWMARAKTLLAMTIIGLGLIIGGAIGNAHRRAAYGAVVDFALFHIQWGGKTLNWWPLTRPSLAGVAALLYDSFRTPDAVKRHLMPADNVLPERNNLDLTGQAAETSHLALASRDEGVTPTGQT